MHIRFALAENHLQGWTSAALRVKPSTMTMSEKLKAIKHDTDKARLSYAPKCALEGMSRALTYGAKKYGKNNYKSGMQWSRVLDALLRHTYAFIDKEDNDPESALCHVDHILACAAMLSFYVSNKVGEDDR